MSEQARFKDTRSTKQAIVETSLSMQLTALVWTTNNKRENTGWNNKNCTFSVNNISATVQEKWFSPNCSAN